MRLISLPLPAFGCARSRSKSTNGNGVERSFVVALSSLPKLGSRLRSWFAMVSYRPRLRGRPGLCLRYPEGLAGFLWQRKVGEGEDARLVVADHPQPPGARDVERKPWRSRPRPAWTCSANVFMPRRMSVTPVASQTRHRPEPGSSPLQDRKNPRQRRSVNRTVDDHSRAACQGELLGHALARRPRREPAAPPRSRKPTIIVFASCVPLPSSIHFSRERPRCLKNNPMS